MTPDPIEEAAREWLEEYGRFYCPVTNPATRDCPACRKHDDDLSRLLRSRSEAERDAALSQAFTEVDCSYTLREAKRRIDALRRRKP